MGKTFGSDKLSAEELHSYVIDNIDRAVSENYIKVYYQPVARTLTGEICGMEALARWDDPEYGLLAPDIFIGALEESEQIHKLDMCMIEHICMEYSSRVAKREFVPTVSFNLSRLDFKLCDIRSYIENTVEKYQVPRDAIRVEITESMMESDDIPIHEVIDSFWEKGIRVWMDDFGSGFSSLNVLKDYHFDTLKIDMIFMRNFNTRAQEIVKSVVDMAKRIGIHTLAEGVETEEQLTFLRNIGCEKAQGYHIGKPMPYSDCLKHLEEKHFTFESPAKRQYYHDIGCVNILSATPFLSVPDNQTAPSYREQQIPTAILELSDKRLHFLFANQTFVSTLKTLDLRSTEEMEYAFGDGTTSFGERFLGIMRKADRSGVVEAMDFQRGNNFCKAEIRRISSYPGGKAYLFVLQNLSRDANVAKETDLSKYIRSLYTIYERIELVDLNTGYSKTLYETVPTIETYNIRPASEELKSFSEYEIFFDDRERFLEFVNLDTLEKRLEKVNTPFISAPFRTRSESGHYIWELYSWLYAGNRSDRKFLCCSRRMENETVANLYAMNVNMNTSEEISAEILWNNLQMSSDVAYFWKDTDRRFLGVNRRFLDYYGFDSMDSVLGKTDEDLGWHINPAPYQNDEKTVLEKGAQTHLVPGSCIRKGENRDIVASKMPIYSDGKIVGLLGYFFDVTDWRENGSELTNRILKDIHTDSLSFVGIVETALRYQDSYAFNGIDFALIYIDLVRFSVFNRDYGIEWGNALLYQVAEGLKRVVGEKGVIGRIDADHFVVLITCDKGSSFADEITEKIRLEISAIKEVKNIPCTVYHNSGYAYFSETRDLQQLIDLAITRTREKRNRS